MRRAMISAGAALLAFGAGAANAEQSCVPEFVGTSVSVSVPNIAVTSGGVTEENFSFRIRNAGGGGKCPASLRVVRDSTSPTTTGIAFSLRGRGRTIPVLPSENAPPTPASNLPLNSIASGSNGENLPMKLVIPSGWGLAAGDTTEDLLIQLFDVSGNLVDTLPLTITISIQPAIELRVVGVTGDNTVSSIALGELDPLAQNLSAPFALRIWSTSPYTVAFQSQNNGGLVRSGSTDRIAYDLLMRGQQVNLAGAVSATIARGTTALGDLHPLSVRIAPFTAKAGQYSDRVEVTVSAT